MTNDLKYAVLAALAYEDEDYVAEKSPYFGYATLGFMTDGPSQGYLFANTHEAVVAYRGTEASNFGLWDIASNVRFLARKWEGPGKAHLGYVRHYRRVRDDLQKLFSLVPANKPLIVCGHSLGGAVATIAAAHDQHVMDWNFKRLITFGSPKALNEEGHAAIRCPHTRYVNRGDWAPSWPFISWNLGHWVPPVAVDSGPGWSRHAPPVYIKALEELNNETGTSDLLDGRLGGV